jgi:predicted transcriptional regulator
MSKTLVEMSASIVMAQARHSRLSSDDIADSLRKVFQTLKDIQQMGNGSEIDEAISRDPQSSIQRNQVVCLECGKAFKLLSNRHLALHGLTPRAYKQKHGMRLTQALSSRALTARRRKVAKELGLGKELTAWRADRKRRVG